MSSLIKTLNPTAAITEKVLGQSTPADTNAASIYSPDTSVISAEIKSILVCNTSAGALSFRIFLDNNGTTYDTTTALIYDKAIAANTTDIVLSGSSIFMNNASGNLAVRSSSANNITFTVFGTELTGSLN